MGHVYFIKHNNISPIKIGHTNDSNVMNRVNSFNTSSPYGIELLGSIQVVNPSEVEREIHEELKEYRLNGEWFDIDYEMVLVILNRYSSNGWERRRIICDIPYQFNYENYSLDELKFFRQFFYKFYLNQKFDFNLVERCVFDAIGMSIQIESAKHIFNKWAKIASLKTV